MVPIIPSIPLKDVRVRFFTVETKMSAPLEEWPPVIVKEAWIAHSMLDLYNRLMDVSSVISGDIFEGLGVVEQVYNLATLTEVKEIQIRNAYGYEQYKWNGFFDFPTDENRAFRLGYIDEMLDKE